MISLALRAPKCLLNLFSSFSPPLPPSAMFLVVSGSCRMGADSLFDKCLALRFWQSALFWVCATRRKNGFGAEESREVTSVRLTARSLTPCRPHYRVTQYTILHFTHQDICRRTHSWVTSADMLYNGVLVQGRRFLFHQTSSSSKYTHTPLIHNNTHTLPWHLFHPLTTPLLATNVHLPNVCNLDSENDR